jgi:hypothetical protein
LIVGAPPSPVGASVDVALQDLEVTGHDFAFM